MSTNNEFLLENEGSFLQSFEWGEFQEKLGRKIWRLNTKGGQALIVKRLLSFGKSYLYIPLGPCFKDGLTDEQKEQALEVLLSEVKKIAKAESSVYCYVEPHKQPSHFCQKRLGCLCPQKRIQPQQTLVLDLTRTEDEIFKNLKSKTTRYNIRFAQKQGIDFVIPKVIGDKEIDIFYNLAQKSAKRDGFTNYDREYFNKLFSISNEELTVKLFFAKHQDKYIAANIFVFFGKTAVHLFGGFDHSFRSLKAPHFMHWNQMLFAKNKMNCEVYDFWGIDEKKWSGITEFKRSFGGKEITYPQGYDLVFDAKWYKLFKLARKILKR